MDERAERLLPVIIVERLVVAAFGDDGVRKRSRLDRRRSRNRASAKCRYLLVVTKRWTHSR
jgi:hypothetical protein